MTFNSSAQFVTAAAFRRSLDERLKTEAKARTRPHDQLRREFLFQRFLGMVFAGSDHQWVLKGGGSLLIRLPDARFSQDLDLLRLGELSADEAISDLRQLTQPSEEDHLRFVVEDGVTVSGTNPVVQIKVTAYIGGKYGEFPIDLARELHFIAHPEKVKPVPVVNVPGLADLPEIVVYPLSDQVGDKVCAMYEVHGERDNPSSRFRDLVDLVLITSTFELDADMISQSLLSEQARRGLVLPRKLISPGPQWPNGYAAIATKSRLQADVSDLNDALQRVGKCLNPILDGSRSTGTWKPGHGWS